MIKDYHKFLLIPISIFFIGILLEIFLTFSLCMNKDSLSENKFDFYEKLSEKEEKIINYISPSVFLDYKQLDYFPLSSVPYYKNILCNENGYFATINSDRYGFNNPDLEWEKEKIEYIIIGDSFAQGFCVNEIDSISGNLRKLVENKGVLNLGNGGTGPLIQFATLREYIELVPFKKVIWIYFDGNDLDDLQVEIKNPVLKNYLENKNFKQNSHQIIKKQKIDLINKFQKELKKKRNKINLFKENCLLNDKLSFKKNIRFWSTREYFSNRVFKKATVIKITPNKSNYSDKTFSDFKKIITKAKELVNEKNGEFYFVYLHKSDISYDKILKLIKNLDIPIININDLLFNNQPPLNEFFSKKKIHYSEKGYLEVAKIIYEKTN